MINVNNLKLVSRDCANDNIALSRRFFKAKFIKSAIIIAFIEIGLIVCLINMDKTLKNILILVALMLFGVLGLLFMKASQKSAEKYVINNEVREYVSFEFKDNVIVGETKFKDNGEVVNKEYDYRLIRSYKEDDTRVYLRVSDTASLVINKSSASKDDIESMKNILRTKGVRVD